MQKILLASFFMMLFIQVNAQNTVTGTVKDTKTETGLSFVSVYFPQLEKGAVTDETGAFKINDLPLGSYKIVASSMGFQSFTKTIIITSGDNTLDIGLTPSAIEMDEVVVSTPFHKLQRENVMKVEKKSIRSMKESGSTTLAQGITQIPGVDIVSTGVSIGKPVIRGLSYNRVVTYTQGVRLENQQFGDEHGLGISGQGLESVEVIKGPASLLYGSDALGGVLYFNPEKFADAGKIDADASVNYFSNTNGVNSTVGVRTSSDKFKFLVRGSYAAHRDYETGGGVSVTNSRFRNYDLKAGLAYQNKNVLSELRYNFFDQKLGVSEELDPIPSKSTDPIGPYQPLQTHILSNKTKILFGNSSLEAHLGYVFNDRKEFEETDQNVPNLHMKLKTFNYKVRYNLPKFGKFETIVGTQGMHQTNKNFGEELLIPDATVNDIGVFGVSHFHLNDKNDVQLGLRYDNRNIDAKGHEDSNPLDKSFGSFNTAIGIRSNFGALTTRLNLATGFRAPNLAELTSNGPHEGTARFEIGNNGLNNESNIQADVDIDYKTNHIDFYVSGFYNKVNDYIFVRPNGRTRVITDEDGNTESLREYNYSQNDAKLYGGEVGFHIHPHPLDWLHIDSSFETVVGKQDNGDYLPFIPANKITSTVRVSLNNQAGHISRKYAFVTLKNVFGQENIDRFETRTGGYSLLDAGIGVDVKILRNTKPVNINITANNLLDKDYVSHLSRLKISGFNNIGRNISFGLTIPL